jgi:CyaY protein
LSPPPEAPRRTRLALGGTALYSHAAMEERDFEKKAAETWKRVLDLFENIESDEADVEEGGDVIRIDYKNGSRVVLNTQRPARQLWLAGGSQAWHFSFDAEHGTWLDDKGRGELFAILSTLTEQAIGLTLRTR